MKTFFKFLIFVFAANLIFCFLGAESATGQGKGSAVPADFVLIKGGTFLMGVPDIDRMDTSLNSGWVQHKVTLSSFYMGKYQVTQKEYEAVMGTNPSNFKGDNLPVEKVNWYEAIEYCNKRSEKEGLTPAYTIDKSKKDRITNKVRIS